MSTGFLARHDDSELSNIIFSDETKEEIFLKIMTEEELMVSVKYEIPYEIYSKDSNLMHYLEIELLWLGDSEIPRIINVKVKFHFKRNVHGHMNVSCYPFGTYTPHPYILFNFLWDDRECRKFMRCYICNTHLDQDISIYGALTETNFLCCLCHDLLMVYNLKSQEATADVVNKMNLHHHRACIHSFRSKNRWISLWNQTNYCILCKVTARKIIFSKNYRKYCNILTLACSMESLLKTKCVHLDKLRYYVFLYKSMKIFSNACRFEIKRLIWNIQRKREKGKHGKLPYIHQYINEWFLMIKEFLKTLKLIIPSIPDIEKKLSLEKVLKRIQVNQSLI
jgi:hypothetical protein